MIIRGRRDLSIPHQYTKQQYKAELLQALFKQLKSPGFLRGFIPAMLQGFFDQKTDSTFPVLFRVILHWYNQLIYHLFLS